jgi:GAF domain-containing protein
MQTSREQRGAQGFIAMLGEADGALDEGLEAGIRGLVDCATVSLGVGGAGIMLADQQQVLRSTTASSEAGRLLQTGQERLGAGPAIDCFERALPVSSSDIRGDDRWPDLRYLLPSAPLHAVLATPVTLAEGPVGTLTVWRVQAGAWSLAEITGVARFARQAASLLELAAHAELRSVLLARLVRMLVPAAFPASRA